MPRMVPRRRTLVAFSVTVLLAVAGLFLAQPELLQQLTTRSGDRPQLRQSFAGGEGEKVRRRNRVIRKISPPPIPEQGNCGERSCLTARKRGCALCLRRC